MTTRRGHSPLMIVLHRLLLTAGCAVALLISTTQPLRGQPPAPADQGVPRLIEGQVYTPGANAEVRPVGGSWVTLHRVAPGDAGPLDSARTDATGRYAISYRRAQADSAVFFISASHHGITYFSSPLANADIRGEDADLVVYDTASAAVPLTVRGRHVIVGALDSTRRHPVVEIFDLLNDTTVTIVASDDRPTWQAKLPDGAQDVRLTAGDISPDAVSVGDGEISIFSPITPGVRQIGFAYSLPVSAFPLALPAEGLVPMMELLVEDPMATVTGPTMEAVDSVETEGRTFRRYMGQDVPAGSVIAVDVPAPPAAPRTLYYTTIVVALGMLMLLALGRSVRRRRTSPLMNPGGGMSGDAEDLAARIAMLDASFQRRRNPTDAERQEYLRTRGGLKAMLTDALMRQDGPR